MPEEKGTSQLQRAIETTLASPRVFQGMSHTASSSSALTQPPAPTIGRGKKYPSGWWDFFKANLPLPIVILLIVWLSKYVESRSFGAYNQRVTMLIGFNIILAVSLQLINGFSGQFSLGHAGFMAVGAYMAAYPAINLSKKLNDPGPCGWFFVTLAILVTVVGTGVLLLFLALRAARRIHKSLPGLLLLGLIAWIMVDLARAANYTDVPGRFVWTHLFTAISDGFGWLLNQGLENAAKVSGWLPESWRQPTCFLVLVIGGGACAAVVGLIVGMPALRLRGDYLAIATLGMAEIIRILIQNSQPLGGALGLTRIPRYTSFSWLYGIAAVTIAVIWRVAYSAKGRAIMAVREDEVAASACGIDATHHKVMSFMIGAFFGGVAGALFALNERNIAPYQFGLQKSIEIVVMVTLGGLGSISGSVIAAIVLTLLLELLREPPSIGKWGWSGIVVLAIAFVIIAILWRDRRWIWTAMTGLILCGLWEFGVFLASHYQVDLAQFRMIIYSLSLILMMLLRPQGLLGGIELWPRRRRWRRAAVATEARDDKGESNA
jgi:ABC-type branched-subunit amino acid transport system permease subunit